MSIQNHPRLCRALLPLLLALTFVSCKSLSSSAGYTPEGYTQSAELNKLIASPSYKHSRTIWQDKKLAPTPSSDSYLLILREEQRGRLYTKGQAVLDFPVSTGKVGTHATPSGVFLVSEKKAAHQSNLYGSYVNRKGRIVKGGVRAGSKRPRGTRFRGATLKYWMRFSGAYGAHLGNTSCPNASHGCVRMPSEVAPRVFQAMQVGSTIEVR